MPGWLLGKSLYSSWIWESLAEEKMQQHEAPHDHLTGSPRLFLTRMEWGGNPGCSNIQMMR